jgi:hypothetical protein
MSGAARIMHRHPPACPVGACIAGRAAGGEIPVAREARGNRPAGLQRRRLQNGYH